METIKMPKDDLLALLKANRRHAAAIDRQAATDYKKNQSEVIAARRKWAKTLAALKNDELAKVDMFHRRSEWPSMPPCPISQLSRLDDLIRGVERDMRKAWTVSDNTHTLKWAVTLGDPKVKTICEQATS